MSLSPYPHMVSSPASSGKGAKTGSDLFCKENGKALCASAADEEAALPRFFFLPFFAMLALVAAAAAVAVAWRWRLGGACSLVWRFLKRVPSVSTLQRKKQKSLHPITK